MRRRNNATMRRRNDKTINHLINELELKFFKFRGKFLAYSRLDTHDELVAQRRHLELLLSAFNGGLTGLKAYANFEMDCSTLTNMLDRPMQKLVGSQEDLLVRNSPRPTRASPTNAMSTF